VVLCVLDGWGIAPPGPANAALLARIPRIGGLLERYPHARLEASGRAVGLPDGVMGNSEVGHLTMGAGYIQYQELVRITDVKLETDYGMQTRVFRFGSAAAPAGPRTWQGVSRAEWVATGAGRGGRRFGYMKSVTTNLRPGYLRKNGVPYSETATITEYFHRLPDAPNGDVWLHVLTIDVRGRHRRARVRAVTRSFTP